MNLITSKLTIINASDLKYVDIEVPEWGGTVRLQELTGIQRDQYEQFSQTAVLKNEYKYVRAKLISMSLVDDKGLPLFTSDELEQVDMKSGTIVSKLFVEALKLNGMHKDSVEEARKNS